MIHATSEPIPYLTRFSDGQHECLADTTAANGGHGAGFRPHDLLEAALANCINMTLRMYAAHHAIPLASVAVKVSLDRTNPEEVVFRYEIEAEGDMTPEQRLKLLRAAGGCPVSKTLGKRIRIEAGKGEPGAQVAM
jgi:putative redox protein